MTENAMNRQVKTKGLNDWEDFGNMKIEDAAIAFVERKNLTTDTVYVVVRDDEDMVEHELTVKAFRAFKVSGLRGGD